MIKFQYDEEIDEILDIFLEYDKFYGWYHALGLSQQYELRENLNWFLKAFRDQ